MEHAHIALNERARASDESAVGQWQGHEVAPHHREGIARVRATGQWVDGGVRPDVPRDARGHEDFVGATHWLQVPR